MEKGRQEDEFFMRAAISEARKALSEEEVPIGAVVVASGRIVGRGHNLVETLRDSTAHAEMQAITAAPDGSHACRRGEIPERMYALCDR